MPRLLLKKLGELLLPERLSDNRTRDLEPLEALLLVYQQNSRLAEQIESHAELAPYPQVAQRLRRIADEKRDVGNRLKENHRGLARIDQRSSATPGHRQKSLATAESRSGRSASIG